MHFSTVAFLALAATAQSTQFYRAASPFQFGLLRRDDAAAYEPDLAECGEGETCAEACGAGHEECPSEDGVPFCYEPGAGETCCGSPKKGASCEAGFFCACDTNKTSVCCGQGLSLADCAADHEDIEGDLTSDPAPEPTTSAEPTESTAETTAEPTASATWPSNNGTITTGGPSATGGAPSPTPSDEVPGAAAGVAPFTAAALLVVGAVAAML